MVSWRPTNMQRMMEFTYYVHATLLEWLKVYQLKTANFTPKLNKLKHAYIFTGGGANICDSMPTPWGCLGGKRALAQNRVLTQFPPCTGSCTFVLKAFWFRKFPVVIVCWGWCWSPPVDATPGQRIQKEKQQRKLENRFPDFMVFAFLHLPRCCNNRFNIFAAAPLCRDTEIVRAASMD